MTRALTSVFRRGPTSCVRLELWALGSVMLGASVAACGSAPVAVSAARSPEPSKTAVTKMVQAVERARQPNGSDEAIALLRQAVREDPSLWEAHYDLGVLLVQRGELGPARGELEQAHELAPNAEDVVAAFGEVLRRSDELKAAVQILATFVGAFPDATQARRELVVVLRESGQAQLGLEHARELLKQEPGSPAALAELALTHLELGQAEIAELLIQQALEVEPHAAVVERTAGLIALRRGEDALAFAHFAKASELDPRDTAAGLNTATVLLQAGVYERAEKHFRAVLAAEPDAEAAKLGLAAALRGQGSRDKPAPYQAAEALLKEILSTTPGNWAAAHNLAVLYAESMDRPSEATALYRVFLSSAPAEHAARAKAQKWVDEHAAPAADASPQAQQ
jgi:protein O-GlcNAc transferase